MDESIEAWTDTTRVHLDIPELARLNGGRFPRKQAIGDLGRVGQIKRRLSQGNSRVKYEYNIESIREYYRGHEMR
jgi:hypothetical protein